MRCAALYETTRVVKPPTVAAAAVREGTHNHMDRMLFVKDRTRCRSTGNCCDGPKPRRGWVSCRAVCRIRGRSRLADSSDIATCDMRDRLSVCGCLVRRVVPATNAEVIGVMPFVLESK